MGTDAAYLAVVFNSTIRLMTPILFTALGSALCNRVFIFNIGLEGMMLTGAFSAIAVNHLTGSVILSILGAVAAAGFVAWIAGIFMVRFKGAMLVVGVAVNILMTGLTTYLMQSVFGVRGAYAGSNLVSLPKVRLEFLRGNTILFTMFGSLTYLDYFAFVTAFLLFVYLFKTVGGFRLRSVGINKEAAESLGIHAERIQIGVITASGVLSGLGGCLLTMGGVTMFAQSITSGRGFIAIAAGALGGAHPLGVIASSSFFGFAQSIANMLQNTDISGQLTMAVPYIATIAGLAVYNSIDIRRRRRRGQ